MSPTATKSNGDGKSASSSTAAVGEAGHLSPSQTSSWPDAIYYQTVILGAGLSGIGMACQMKRKGFGDDFIILDKEAGIAGTWYSNTYPGAGADVPAPLYSFSFRQKTNWSTFFPKQPELEAYISTVAAEYDLMDKFHLSTVIREARFDEDSSLWHLYTEDLPERKAKEGVEPRKHHYVCKFLVSCIGALSSPNPCTIEGHESFKGPIFHSARWDHSIDLKGKNVVVVGNGSSATQFIPKIITEAKSVTQFVRAQHWILPKVEDPFRRLPGWKWLIQHVSFFKNLQRLLIFLVMESHFTGTLMNVWVGKFFRWSQARQCTAYAKKNCPKKYLHHILPDPKKLPPMHKRRLVDTDAYVPALNAPNFKLEFERTARMTEHAVITDTGKKIPADVVILATGFTPSRAGFPMELYGVGGMELRDHWEKYGDGGPLHYRSTFLSGFPNLVQMTGTNSATGHTSLIFTTENQIELALEIAKPLLDNQRPSLEAIRHVPSSSLRKDALTSSSSSSSSPETVAFPRGPTFNVKLRAEIDEQYWLHATMKNRVFSSTHGSGSWYLDKNSGRVTAMHPDWQWKLMIRCLVPNWKDFEYENLASAVPPSSSEKIGGEKKQAREEAGRLYPEGRTWWKLFLNRFGVGTVPKVSAQQAGMREYQI